MTAMTKYSVMMLAFFLIAVACSTIGEFLIHPIMGWLVSFLWAMALSWAAYSCIKDEENGGNA